MVKIPKNIYKSDIGGEFSLDTSGFDATFDATMISKIKTSLDSSIDTVTPIIKTPERPKKRISIRNNYSKKLEGYHKNFKVVLSPKELNSPRRTRRTSRLTTPSGLKFEKKTKTPKKSLTPIVVVKTSGKRSKKVEKEEDVEEKMEEVERNIEEVEEEEVSVGLDVSLNRESIGVMSEIDMRSVDERESEDELDRSELILSAKLRSSHQSRRKRESELSREDFNTTKTNLSFDDLVSEAEEQELSVEADEVERDDFGSESEDKLAVIDEDEEEAVKFVRDGKERVVNPVSNKAPTPNKRRSKRRRWNPLRYWRGERVVYAKNTNKNIKIEGAYKTMLVSSPAPPKLSRSRALTKRKRKRDSHELAEHLNLTKVQSGKVEIFDDETSETKNIVFESEEEAGWTKHKVLDFENAEDMLKEYPPLDLTQSDVEKAYIKIQLEETSEERTVGNICIPPKSMKLMEITGEDLTIFKVLSCQKDALAFRIEDDDFLIEKGMTVQLPRATLYGFENMSVDCDAIISFNVEKGEED